MLNIQECQTAKSDITELEILNDSLGAYSTKLHGIKFFNPNECEIKKSITNVYLNHEVTCCTFSPDSKLFAFSNNRTIYFIDIKTKELLPSIQTENEDIEILKFDPSSTYIIAGTKNGRVLQYKYNNSSLLSRLCSFPYDRATHNLNPKENNNYVSSFAFYDNYLASTGYGGAIFITDLRLKTKRCIVTHNKSRKNALCFLDKDTIISGTDSGEIHITSLVNVKEYRSITTPLSSVKQILLMQNPNYIMVSGKNNIISIINIKTLKIVHNRYLEMGANIVKITLLKHDYLVVAQENKKIQIIELPSQAKLKSLIQQNYIEKAFKLIAKDPMLKGSYEHKLLENKFDKAYHNATQSLINQNKAKAVKILTLYKDIKSKQIQIRNLFNAFKNYSNFQALFYEKKYALVYAMASKFSALKQTAQYKRTEQIFKVAFANAQRHVIQGNMDGARALLNAYNTVISKKPIIKMILTQNKEFLFFLNAIQKKDFDTVYELVDTNKLFKQIPNYTSLNDEIEEKLEDIKESIKNAQLDKADEQLLSLKKITHIKSKLKKLQEDCEHMRILYKAYIKNDFKTCYKILDLYKSLNYTNLGIFLEKHWSKVMIQCESFALDGNIKRIKELLNDLIDLPTRHIRIGDLLRVSFHVKIKLLISKKNYKVAETIIYSYVDIFGLDSEIYQLMQKFELTSFCSLAITQTQENRPTRDSWINSQIIVKKNP